ncbi:MAG TPA: septation protein SepH [Nocardioides sp.]|nr:septation protein SepH [Nocardioides sp.]
MRVTDSGRALLLRDEDGGEFHLEITPLLRTSVHGGTPRRSETKMTSSLRPRDIQNRIRSGESPESVAEAAGTTVEAIMPYVAPVVAEREHVAATAQRASLRRGPGEPSTPPINRVLGDAVALHLDAVGAKAEDVTWDAYRRETGRWVLTASYAVAGRSGTARFTYDAPGNYALTDDDDARWLIGDLVEPAPAAEPVDDLQQFRARRMASTSAADLPLGGSLGDDALDLVDPSAPVAEPPAHQGQLPFDEPLRSTVPEPPPVEAEAPAESAGDAESEESAEAARHRRQAQKKRGRASVPSWDEIMFGPTGE